MRIACGVLGILLLLLVLSDIAWTTFLEAGGPLTRRVCGYIGRMVLFLRWRCGSRRVMTVGGLLTVMGTALLWVGGVWIAWTLIYNAAPDTLVNSSTGLPADWFQRFYFSGYTIFTLGLGDFQPVGRLWQFVTDVAAGSGFLFFGLAVAYIVPVVSAATQKRQLSLCIWSLGRTPAEIIERSWNGADTTALSPHLVSLIPMLAQLGENHLTYPVLHFFQSRKRSSSVAPNVAALDEALTILECGLQKGCSLDLPSLGAARTAITVFLETLKPALILPAKDVPPIPTLKGLRDAGIAAVDDDIFAASVETLRQRRQLLLALVRGEGWRWDVVWPEDPNTVPVDKGAA